MDTIRLSKETKQGLIGKKIIDCGDNYIKLDNGCCIYLDESEIDNLGSEKIEREFDDHDSSITIEEIKKIVENIWKYQK